MKNKEEIFITLKEILINDFEAPETLTLSSHLYNDLDLDSIDAIDLVVKLRELTGKRIEPEQFKQVRTVEDVVIAIENLMTTRA